VRLASGEVRMENPQGLKEKDRKAGFILTCVAYPLGSVALEA